jgi:hypothetical protein
MAEMSSAYEKHYHGWDVLVCWNRGRVLDAASMMVWCS